MDQVLIGQCHVEQVLMSHVDHIDTNRSCTVDKEQKRIRGGESKRKSGRERYRKRFKYCKQITFKNKRHIG